MNHLLDIFCKSFSINSENFKKLLFALLLISTFFFLPFFTRNVPYYDDHYHESLGSCNLSMMARPLASYIMGLVNFNFDYNFLANNTLVNSAPFNIIISLIIFCIAITIFSLSIYKDEEINLFHVLTSFSIMACPFYLQVVTYNFESIIPTVSFSLALLAALNPWSKNNNLIIGTILLFASIGVYQIGFNFFLGAVFVLLLIKATDNPEKALEDFIFNLIKVAIAASCYKFLLYPSCNVCDFAKERSELIAFDTNFFVNSLKNLNYHVQAIFEVFSDSYFLLAFLVIAILAFLVQSFKHKDSAAIPIILLGTCGLLISSVGILIFLKIPFAEPRSFAAFALVIFFAFYAFQNTVGKWVSFSNIILILISLFFMFISYGFQNIQRSQNQFNTMISHSIKYKLEELGINEKTTVIADGSLGLGRRAGVSLNNNTILKHITKPHEISGNWYSGASFAYIDLNVKMNDDLDLKEALCKKESIYKNSFYRIAKDKDTYFIAFRYGECYQEEN